MMRLPTWTPTDADSAALPPPPPHSSVLPQENAFDTLEDCSRQS